MKNKNPIVFVHGMFGWGDGLGINKIAPYWGGTTGSLGKYLQKNEIECYFASVGPVCSAWDNACELYAQLTGTRVDYGKAHSEKHGHDRYGRTYKKPMLESFGKEKIHLIGHSHGGQVSRLLAHLLSHGDREEIEATDKDDLSPLFTGGKEDFVSSVTTICTPNNGTTLFGVAEEANIIEKIVRLTDIAMWCVGKTFLHGRFVDYQLEQYGLTPVRGEIKSKKLSEVLAKLKVSTDDVLTDLSFHGANLLNKRIEISNSVNYFCYTSNATSGPDHKPDNFSLKPLIILSKQIKKQPLPKDKYSIHFDESWYENDGLVNTPSGRNPVDEPHKEYDGNIETGIWNVMPTLKGDHGRIVGLLSNKKEVRNFYIDHINILLSTEKTDCSE